jgi:NADPH2:quinone reductase
MHAIVCQKHGNAGLIIENTAIMRSSMQRLFDWLAEGRLRVLVGQRFPLREAPAVHRCLEGRQSQGKILLLP